MTGADSYEYIAEDLAILDAGEPGDRYDIAVMRLHGADPGVLRQVVQAVHRAHPERVAVLREIIGGKRRRLWWDWLRDAWHAALVRLVLRATGSIPAKLRFIADSSLDPVDAELLLIEITLDREAARILAERRGHG